MGRKNNNNSKETFSDVIFQVTADWEYIIYSMTIDSRYLKNRKKSDGIQIKINNKKKRWTKEKVYKRLQWGYIFYTVRQKENWRMTERLSKRHRWIELLAV